MALTLRIITPDSIVWDEPVQEVILPSKTGQLGVLSGHAPLLSALETGVMRVRPGKDWQAIAVFGGFVEVENNEIKVLVNGAEMGEAIDKEAARQEFNQAQIAVEKASTPQQKIQANQALKRARARFQAAGGMV
ncbi:MAG: F0F1 ATP synthase subunit epsilon [Cyanobacteria bacterium J083]|nr:MAG: F0F1 ATP synthase subunit epsilon [Cyanobacteria bacterium J083]